MNEPPLDLSRVPWSEQKEAGAVEWNPERVVIIEFPDMDSLNRWYGSPEYPPLIAAQGVHERSGYADHPGRCVTVEATRGRSDQTSP